MRASLYIQKHAASHGNAEAQYRLACAYYYGDGVEKDAETAVYWLTKAANQGNAKAAFNLGNCYRNGKGTDKNPEKAASWYLTAVKLGNTEAREKLEALQRETPSLVDYAEEQIRFITPFEELQKLIGMNQVKTDINNLISLVKVQKMRQSKGMKAVPVARHLVFTGNPGTGKTTLARILGKIYKEIGVLSRGHLVEVDRSALVAGYVGQTAMKTRLKIREAKGGVLFIDEAYALAKGSNDFGQEAIDTLLKAMEDKREDFVVIVAGYPDKMQTFINSNPGLQSRFNKFFSFPDYTVSELADIFASMCLDYDYRVTDEAKEKVRKTIARMVLVKGNAFANGRDIRTLFESAVTNQAIRIGELEHPSEEVIQLITAEDISET